jgi:transcriptional regulator with XRE-family HTH domain
MDNARQLKAIGARIRKVRKDRGYTIHGAARLIGMDRSYYRRTEQGKQNITALNILRIARGLRCSPREFFRERV